MEYDRYRTRSTPNAPGVSTSTWQGGQSGSTIALPALESEQTYDMITPNFHRRRAAGEIFNNSFLSVKSKCIVTDYATMDTSSTGGYFEHHVRDRFLMTAASASWPVPVVSLDTDDVVRNAQISAQANVNATQVDVLAFAGEWAKTRALHRDLGNALLELFSKMPVTRRRKARFKKTVLYDERGNPVLNRKGDPVYRYLHEEGDVGLRGETFGKRLANFYLVNRYGILPLLSDLEGATKVLQKVFDPRYTARGNASAQGQSSSIYQISAGYYGTWDVLVTTTRTFSARYGILYESDPYTRTLARLGLTRPLSSAWQLMPWSFVGDWFLEVGKYLDAIQPAGFTKILCPWGGTQDYTVETYVPHAYHPYSGVPQGSTWSFSFGGSVLKTNVVKRRDPWYTTGILPRPGFGSGFNAMRSGDFAALMLQRIRGRF